MFNSTIAVKKFLLILLPSVLVLAFSCSRRVESPYDSIGLVDMLVTDSLPALQRLARGACAPTGVIVISGEPEQCLALSEKMLRSDEFDNVDAKRVSDGLPDFSGETVVSILDFANSPYDSLAATEEGRLKLREIAVRTSLAALDSSARCKVLILCSPQIAEKGGDDVSDFFEKIGCDVPVIYSTDTTFSFTGACFKVMRERNIFTHNIAYPVARLMMTLQDSSNPPFSAVPFDDDLVPESFADTVGILAPNTFVSYVQNKHKP